jgi:hypothetical protein
MCILSAISLESAVCTRVHYRRQLRASALVHIFGDTKRVVATLQTMNLARCVAVVVVVVGCIYWFACSQLAKPTDSHDDCLYGWLVHWLVGCDLQLSPLATLAAGGVAGTCFWLSNYPFDVVKNKIMVSTMHRSD